MPNPTRFRMAYAEEAEAVLMVFINDFAKSLGIKSLNFNFDKCHAAIMAMERDFPHSDGMENASPFKKAATFVTYFVGERPILEAFPKEAIGSLADISNHQNAIIAYEYAVEMLHDAKIMRSDGLSVVLKNPIRVSLHSYKDIIEALSSLAPATHFKLVSVFFEQLAYRSNPEASYPVD